LECFRNYYQSATLSNGNTTIQTGNYDFIPSTIQASSGKYYAEVKIEATPSNNAIVGITGKSMTDTQNYLGKNNYEYGYIGSGSKVNNASFTSYGDSFTAGDIIGVALDLDNNKLYFSKNGTWQNSGDPTSGATATGAISITDPASTSNGAYFMLLQYVLLIVVVQIYYQLTSATDTLAQHLYLVLVQMVMVQSLNLIVQLVTTH
jgi:hypothetical protein